MPIIWAAQPLQVARHEAALLMPKQQEVHAGEATRGELKLAWQCCGQLVLAAQLGSIIKSPYLTPASQTSEPVKEPPAAGTGWWLLATSCG